MSNQMWMLTQSCPRCGASVKRKQLYDAHNSLPALWSVKCINYRKCKFYKHYVLEVKS